MAFKFEKLEVWKKSLDLSVAVHDASKKFLKEDSYQRCEEIHRIFVGLRNSLKG